MKHNMLNIYHIRFKENEPFRVDAVCKHDGCSWFVKAGLLFKDLKTIVIKKFCDVHSCGATFVGIEKYPIYSKFVKSVVVKLLDERSNMTPREVIDYF